VQTTIEDRIRDHARRRGRGKVFTPKDFRDIGSRQGVDQALSRLTKERTLNRIGRGLYCYPRINRQLGIAVPPDLDEIADALARQTGSRIVPSGATAANQLGLSTQVPAKPVYLTDGRSRTVRVGNFEVVLKHAPPKELPVANRKSATVLQALRHLGPDAVDDRVLQRIRKMLTARERVRLLRDARYTTDWIAAAVGRIAAENKQRSGS
jgi:hypothetical protein